MKRFKGPHNALLYFGILAALYLILTLALPPSHMTMNLYHLSALQYRVLIFVVLLPVIAIWLAAFYGYWKIKEYASLIEDTLEGPAYRFIADGMMWLAWGLPIPAIISAVVSAIANNNPGFYEASVIITNYANLIVPFIALHILSSGSRTLLERANLRISIITTKLLVLLFVILGSVYCYYVFHDTSRAHSVYFLPNWLLLFTIVVPYLYAWFMGLLAAYEINLISHHSGGLLYKQALQHLARGLTIIVASSIGLQYLRSLLSPKGLSLGYILVVIYILLFIIGAGYALMAYGAKKLKRIEEV